VTKREDCVVSDTKAAKRLVFRRMSRPLEPALRPIAAVDSDIDARDARRRIQAPTKAFSRAGPSKEGQR
jgi:hypothetical protein